MHQIYLSIYAEECSTFKVTSVQHAIMAVVHENPGLEQGRVALEVGVDRTTMADVTRRLEKRGLIERSHDPSDRRTRRLHLTQAGLDTLQGMGPAIERVHARLVEPLPTSLREALSATLIRLIAAHNEDGRVPMRLG
ncbi:MarR family winged helix-turn-helix transcriptional regulator [Zavarzinia sp. CC-PAN008]|uniref:MarR family winged helix-turn-helix transcriptional regulator n=1 Tax=Zavarzinia sp. CC-PAN008 TaxID=3243332 RepID=UPI003F742234